MNVVAARLISAYAAVLSIIASLTISAAVAVETFSAKDLMNGTKSSPQACAALPKSVFIRFEGEGICIRYYISGLAAGQTAVVFFPGDSFGADERGKIGPDPGYLTQAPEYIDIGVRVWSQRLAAPVIFFGRMGLHGSSGWHGNRRTRLEVGVTLAALDQIKAREGLAGYHLVGQSGGGILAEAALAKRDDIGCAAIASTPLAFATFAKMFGIRFRKEGKLAHHEAMNDVAAVAASKVRILFLTDPKDMAVPPITQTEFIDAVKAAGGTFLHILTGGRGAERHALTEKAMFSTALCIAGAKDEDILARYGNTGPDDLPPP